MNNNQKYFNVIKKYTNENNHDERLKVEITHVGLKRITTLLLQNLSSYNKELIIDYYQTKKNKKNVSMYAVRVPCYCYDRNNNIFSNQKKLLSYIVNQLCLIILKDEKLIYSKKIYINENLNIRYILENNNIGIMKFFAKLKTDEQLNQ